MQLTKQQKEDLKLLTESRGFKVLEEIVEDKRQSLFSQFEDMPLWDGETLQKLSGSQNFNKGMKYLIDTAKAKHKWVVKAPEMK